MNIITNICFTTQWTPQYQVAQRSQGGGGCRVPGPGLASEGGLQHQPLGHRPGAASGERDLLTERGRGAPGGRVRSDTDRQKPNKYRNQVRNASSGTIQSKFSQNSVKIQKGLL